MYNSRVKERDLRLVVVMIGDISIRLSLKLHRGNSPARLGLYILDVLIRCSEAPGQLILYSSCQMSLPLPRLLCSARPSLDCLYRCTSDGEAVSSLAPSALLAAEFDLVPVLGPTLAPHHGSPTAHANLTREAFRLEELDWLLGLVGLLCKLPRQLIETKAAVGDCAMREDVATTELNTGSSRCQQKHPTAKRSHSCLPARSALPRLVPPPRAARHQARPRPRPRPPQPRLSVFVD